MNAADQKKAKVLLMLLVIAGLTWYLVYRLGPEVPASASSTPAAKTARGAKASPRASTGDGSIRLDLLEEPVDSNSAGAKNLFQYQPKPQPPRAPAPPPVTYIPPQVPLAPSGPPPPPAPPPFKAFRYESWIKTNGKLTAQLIEGTNTYQAFEGEVLLGQYKITRLTEAMVEIEDMALKRRQTFPKVQQ